MDYSFKRFTYSACGLFKKQRTTRKFKETEDSRYIYQNENDNTYFKHHMSNGAYEDLAK